MIYKFDSNENFLEVKQTDRNEINISIVDYNYKHSFDVYLDSEQLYDLIGCLHSLKAKLDKGGNNE